MAIPWLKPVVFGVLFGAMAFLMPFFLLKVVFFLMIVFVLFRFFGPGRFGGRSYGRQWRGGWLHHADKIRNMSDEEYAAFKIRMQERYKRCHPGFEEKTGDSETATVNA